MFKIFQENRPISWILSQKDYIDFSPTYQRMGSVWKKDQKQLLIDSIINGFDIPKLYFQFMPQEKTNHIYNYAVIDGKQRLETIIEFINDKFPLSDDFKFLCDCPNGYYADISGKKFSEIDAIEPSITAKIMTYELCIVFMDTDNPDIINETFIRLNSGIAVNTAEKRNAIGGILAQQMKTLYTESPFFKDKITLTNSRYAHFDLALKLLMIEMGYDDLSRKTVNKFVEHQKEFGYSCQQAFESLKQKLDKFINNFTDRDKLLSKKSIIITLYSICHKIPDEHIKPFLYYFENLRGECLQKYSMNGNNTNNMDVTDTLMLEFTRHLQQGADKKTSLESRIDIMEKILHRYLVSALGYISNSD